MSVPVGLQIPKLLPITGTFLAPFSLYYLSLSLRVVQQRVQNEKWIESKSSESADDALQAACRAQMNFAEYVPLALVAASVCELNGGNRKALTGGLSALLLFRILHAELGILAKNYMGNGRPIGYFGTLGVISGFAGYAGYLVKGYWGF